MWIKLLWTQHKRWGWKLLRKECCWESRLNHTEGYETQGYDERKNKIWKVGVHSMKESSGKAMEVNKELWLNVGKQQDDKNI